MFRPRRPASRIQRWLGRWERRAQTQGARDDAVAADRWRGGVCPVQPAYYRSSVDIDRDPTLRCLGPKRTGSLWPSRPLRPYYTALAFRNPVSALVSRPNQAQWRIRLRKMHDCGPCLYDPSGYRWEARWPEVAALGTRAGKIRGAQWADLALGATHRHVAAGRRRRRGAEVCRGRRALLQRHGDRGAPRCARSVELSVYTLARGRASALSL